MATLSNVTSRASRNRPLSRQSIQTLEFIHRFRHVTTKHVQPYLGHTNTASSHKQLIHLLRQGYIGRQYYETDRATHRYASYYLTPKGLQFLKQQHASRPYRLMRSIRTDAVLGANARQRYHTLADTYGYFKRHFNGSFEFFSSFDLTGLEDMPSKLPDGYVRLKLASGELRHYFIEIFGWGRSSHEQEHRLRTYVEFADWGTWREVIGGVEPRLLIVAGGSASHRRLRAQMEEYLDTYLIFDSLLVFTTTVTQLARAQQTVWHKLVVRAFIKGTHEEPFTYLK